MQPRLVLNIGPALMPDFVTGAMFHAILAYPTNVEISHFERISQELTAGMVRKKNAHDRDAVEESKARFGQIDWDAIEALARKPKPALGYLEKRLNQRMAAARAGIGKAHERIFGKPATLPPGMTDLSIDQLCKLIRSDVVINDPDNIEKHVWRKSLPIVHLAMATQLLLAGKFKDRAEYGCDLQDLEFYRDAVRISQRLEQTVHDHPDFAINRDQMTLVRWFE